MSVKTLFYIYFIALFVSFGFIHFVPTMDATHPATRSTLSFQQLRYCTLDMVSPGFWFFGSDDPADPLIACQRCEVLPPF